MLHSEFGISKQYPLARCSHFEGARATEKSHPPGSSLPIEGRESDFHQIESLPWGGLEGF